MPLQALFHASVTVEDERALAQSPSSAERISLAPSRSRIHSIDSSRNGSHEARHTYVSLMHAACCSLEEIGDFVGHSSTYMVDRYRHLLDGQRERAAERLDLFLTGAQNR